MSNRFSRTGRRVVVPAAALVAAGATLVGTGLGGASQAAAPAAAAEGAADWTMMVYAVGDTSGVPQLMVENLTNIAQLPDADNVNVVVLLDLPEATDTDAPTSQLPGVGDFSTAKLLVLEDGRYNEVRDLGEVSMGRPDVLASFVEEAADRFPAQHYGFTFFDHGGGNTGGYVDTGPPGTQDLSLPEMRSGLLQGMQRAGIDRFDVINQAACLMANYETSSALAPLAEWMGASEELMIQWPLAPESLVPMANGGTGQDVANEFVNGYVSLLDGIAAQPGGQQYRDLLSMSVVDGDAVANLDRAVESFSQAAVANMPQVVTQLARARAAALEFVTSIPGQEDNQFDLIDLGDFMKHLTDVPDDVAVARDAVSAALDRAVTLQATGRATEQSTGMNVYFPSNPQYVNGAALTDGTEPPGWAELITAFVDEAASQGGTGSGGQTAGGVGFTSEQAQVLQQDASGVLVGAQLAEGSRANVTSAETYVFTRAGGQDQVLGLIVPAYLDAGGPGQVQGSWNYALTTLTDGERSVPATAVFQAQSGGLVGSFVAQYTDPAGGVTDVGVRMLLSSQGQIQSVSTVDVTSGTAAPVQLQEGGRLQPYLYVPSSGGYEPVLSDQQVPVSARLQIAFQKLPRATPFSIALVAGDAAGNYAAAQVGGETQ